MPVNPKLLDILLCPVTQQSLRLVSDEELADINVRIADGDLNHEDDSPVKERVEAALITADGERIYKVESDIPIMLPNQSIPVTSVSD